MQTFLCCKSRVYLDLFAHSTKAYEHGEAMAPMEGDGIIAARNILLQYNTFMLVGSD